ncbi:hypothetical protein E9531_02805 [Lampropedia puyangensis]|uniref:Molecular chaperone DnaJ n=1 Tax=Lampropedia puyangensis TaxID=1330072 RepID=A0A4S8FIP6_9BURK|nr:hypothetical protein [Lampropedia puyangensis]THU05482.1 hypothetical protein E9531_02805 [Lampropedia puyangensis]
MPSPESAPSKQLLQQLAIAPTGAQTFTPAQKHFNNLVKKLQRQGDALKKWEQEEAVFQNLWRTEYVPLEQKKNLLNWQLACLLDNANATIKLTEADLETLSDVVLDLCEELLQKPAMDEPSREQLHALYDKHSDSTLEAQMNEAKEQIRAQMEDMLGMDLSQEDIDLDNPEAFIARMLQRLQQEQAESDDTTQPHRAGHQTEAKTKPQTKAQQKREQAKQKKLQEQREAEQQASQSLQSIFRKLSSALHPDREPDPTERERKTALMQRVTAAYRTKDLLQLLQLQLEVEQIDPNKLSQLADTQLSHYNRVLTQQSEELKIELLQVQAQFKMRYHLDPICSVTSKDFKSIITDFVEGTQEEIAEIEEQLTLLQTSKGLKRWLNNTRKAIEKQMQHEKMLHTLASSGFTFR